MTIQRAPEPSPLLSKTELFARIDSFLQKNSKPLLSLVGATASGKTGLSIDLCKKYNGEVVNADSRQFYRDLNIGTAKITPEEMQGVPHHLLDILSPDEPCSIGWFKKKADITIADILSRGKIPFLVGGSGLFVCAVCNNYSIPPPGKSLPDAEKKSDQELFSEIQKIDPEYAKEMDGIKRRRILRALEVFHATGKKMSSFQKKGDPLFQSMIVSIFSDPDILNMRIEKRAKEMWKEGFLEEVRRLQEKGHDQNSPGMISHGYPEALSVLQENMSPEEAQEQMIRNTRRYAKRQRTWWRKEKDIVWYRGA